MIRLSQQSDYIDWDPDLPTRWENEDRELTGWWEVGQREDEEELGRRGGEGRGMKYDKKDSKI